jgi:hypothetical protein
MRCCICKLIPAGRVDLQKFGRAGVSIYVPPIRPGSFTLREPVRLSLCRHRDCHHLRRSFDSWGNTACITPRSAPQTATVAITHQGAPSTARAATPLAVPPAVTAVATTPRRREGRRGALTRPPARCKPAVCLYEQRPVAGTAENRCTRSARCLASSLIRWTGHSEAGDTWGADLLRSRDPGERRL